MQSVSRPKRESTKWQKQIIVKNNSSYKTGCHCINNKSNELASRQKITLYFVTESMKHVRVKPNVRMHELIEAPIVEFSS